MKSSIRAALAVGALALASSQAIASTYYDNTTTSFSLGANGAPENYVGNIDVGGVDTWTINLTNAAGVTIDITTSQGVGQINPQDIPTAILMLPNITQVDLLDASNNVVGSGAATYALTTLFGQSTLASSVSFAVNSLLLPGAYSLKIYGDDGAAYSGTISAVPLPAAAWLFGSALLGLGALRRKQKAGDNSEMAAA